MADPQHTVSKDRLFGIQDVAAPTGLEAAAFDRDAIDRVGAPQSVLMENAGRSAAQILHRVYPEGPVAALVGSGNNGSDALVLLRTLRAWGREVKAVLVADREPDSLLHGWDIPMERVDESTDDPGACLGGASILVDGVLGTGIRGAPRPRQARIIEAVNRSSAPVLALDVASGVDAATGAVPGEAVRAELTVAFGWPKLGSLLPPGREHGGRLVVVEIGFPPQHDARFGARLITPGWARGARPGRRLETHKYEVGTLVLVAGGEGMAGACVLAARAAQRAGLGLLRVASVAGNREILQATVPEAVFVDLDDPRALAGAMEGAAVAVGPGLGRDSAAAGALDRVMAQPGERPVVMDADALTLASDGRLDALRAMASRRQVVLTPHVGELERISAHTRQHVRDDRVGVARAVAAELGAVVLLKGMPSVVAAPEGQVLVDMVATSDLATGGMGDVLTGVLGSLVAQGASPLDAAGVALFHTGRAARLADRGAGLIPQDVVQRLPDAFSEAGPGWTDLDLPFVRVDRDRPR